MTQSTLSTNHSLKKFKCYTLNESEKGTHLGMYNAPLSQQHVDKIVSTYYDHLIPSHSERHLLESTIFCLSSAKTPYERAVRFIHSLKDIPTPELYDDTRIFYQAKNGPVKLLNTHTNIFESAMKYFDAFGGVQKAFSTYANNPKEFRKELVREVKYMAHKTASFTGLTWGISKDIFTIDVHVTRQLANLGFSIDFQYSVGTKRKDGRVIPNNHPPKMYESLEEQIISFVKKTSLTKEFPEFLNDDGSLHTGLLTTLFWLPGTEIQRKQSTIQIPLISDVGFISPYSREHNLL